jgi:hypothetical protein
MAGRSRIVLANRKDRLTMPRPQHAIGATISLAASLWLVGGGFAAAQSIPAAGRYQCTGGSGTAAALNFAVGPGNIYTTKAGSRGTMVIPPARETSCSATRRRRTLTKDVIAPALRRKSRL